MTVLFVEHDMDMVRDISDWVIVMAQGKVIAEGPPESVMSDARVIDAYLGSHHDAPLTEEEEQQILAEAEEALERERSEQADRDAADRPESGGRPGRPDPSDRPDRADRPGKEEPS
jgi:branched-chain amino acid transport system ATP-binding protein